VPSYRSPPSLYLSLSFGLSLSSSPVALRCPFAGDVPGLGHVDQNDLESNFSEHHAEKWKFTCLGYGQNVLILDYLEK
jgi:hypothetical protein